MTTRTLAALIGAAALAIPAAAAAKPHHKPAVGHHTNKAKKVMFVFKGTFTAPGTLEVTAGNAHVRKGGFVGQTVTFDLANATVVAADTNADRKTDLADVKDGDRVRVQTRMPRRTKYEAPADGAASEAMVARKLIDRTNPPVD